jgi:hypothetical protein
MEATNKKSQILKTAHAIAKTLDCTIKYAKRLGQAIKMAWANLKATLKVAVAFVWTAIGAKAIEKMESAKETIVNGGKWNGIVYGKAVNKNECEINVYVSGNIYTFRVWKENFEAAKKEVQSFLANTTTTTATGKAQWLVNGKPVTNNLNWGQMWDKYGTDFE